MLTFQPAVEQVAACGRSEKRVVDLEVDFAGIQEGRQRSRATRQVGRYLVGVSCCGPRQRWQPDTWIHRCARFQTETHRALLCSDASQLRLVRLRSSQEPGSVVRTTQSPGITCMNWICRPFRSCDRHAPCARVSSNTCLTDWQRAASGGRMSMEQVCVFCWRPCNCR